MPLLKLTLRLDINSNKISTAFNDLVFTQLLREINWNVIFLHVCISYAIVHMLRQLQIILLIFYSKQPLFITNYGFSIMCELTKYFLYDPYYKKVFNFFCPIYKKMSQHLRCSYCFKKKFYLSFNVYFFNIS